MKYKIKFKHIIEETYSAIVTADNKKQAIELFDDSPFDYVVIDEPEDVQGLDVSVIDCEVING